jgi:RNA polymerase sigma-70 factor (ECF subfamily)
MREAGEPTPAPPHTLPGFTALVEAHQRDLLRFLRGIVPDPEQARDLLQDTFYDAWRAARRGAAPFDSTHAPDEGRRWLFHTAYCRALSARRRHRLIHWESLDGDAAAAVEASGHLVAFEDQIAESEALNRALSGLAPEDIACLLLIVMQGFTAAEAGAIIGASAQAVAKRIARAKRRLLDAYLTRDNPDQKGASR